MTAAVVGRRAALVALLAVVLLAAGLSSQAMAAGADVSNFHGDEAVADWSMDDDRNTHVAVGAMDGRIVGQSPLPDDHQSVYLSVTQSYCDEDAGEQVHRSWFGFAEDGASIEGGALSQASADMKTTVQGYELRGDGCDGEPVFLDPDDETHLGEREVALSADWEATGPMEVSVRNFHFSGGDFVFNGTNVERSRDAEATGTLTGLAAVDSDLGASDHAEIVAIISGSVAVQR